jgi:hypothetical protein
MTTHETSPAETPTFIGRLPFRSVKVDEPDCNLDVSVWSCDENICEHRPEGRCDTVAGVYYGSAEDPVTKFCPRHFYDMHDGTDAAYRLVDTERLSKGDVGRLVRESDDAFWHVIARRFPHAKHGDLSPERTVALNRAQEEAVNEWIRNNVNPQHGDDEAA